MRMNHIKIFILVLLFSFQTFAQEIDPNTFSNYSLIKINKVGLLLNVDMEKQIISGTTIQEFIIQSETNIINLDTKDIIISSIKFNKLDGETEYKVKEYKIIETNSPVGDKLEIQVDKNLTKKSRIQLQIDYQTIEGGGRGINFLKEDQTLEKQPYMYTLFEPIYARTFVPIQDTPQAKFTWEAQVTVNNDNISAFMSGYVLSQEESTILKYIQGKTNLFQKATTTHMYQQQKKVSSYLIALVIGKIDIQTITGTNRCFVMAEPSLIDQADKKLKNLELYLTVAEDLVGQKYPWGTFTVLIMPDNYPFEGMEHPQLTYASKSILNSGKTGTSTILHEIANTWFGNLVTAVDWRNLWLNEGFSQYIVRESQVILFEQPYMELDRVVGNNNLIEDILFYGEDDSFTSLYPKTQGIDPTDIFTEVPIEKGYQFLYYLQKFMKQSQFQTLLQQYINKYEYQAVDYISFQSFYIEWVETNLEDQKEFLDKIDWDAWIIQPGFIPENTIKPFTSSLYQKATQLSYKFLQFGGSAIPDDYEDYFDFNQDQKYAFIDYMLMGDNLYAATRRLCEQLDDLYDFSTDEDFNLLYRWFSLTVLLRYDNYVDKELANFLGATGRIKFLMPVYKSFQLTNRLTQANKYLNMHKDFYHPIAVKEINEVLGNENIPNSITLNQNDTNQITQY